MGRQLGFEWQRYCATCPWFLTEKNLCCLGTLNLKSTKAGFYFRVYHLEAGSAACECIKHHQEQADKTKQKRIWMKTPEPLILFFLLLLAVKWKYRVFFWHWIGWQPVIFYIFSIAPKIKVRENCWCCLFPMKQFKMYFCKCAVETFFCCSLLCRASQKQTKGRRGGGNKSYFPFV